MTETVGTHANLLRIAAAQSARPSVDHNGRTKGEPTTYTYDSRGLLVSAKPSPDSALGRAIAGPDGGGDE